MQGTSDIPYGLGGPQFTVHLSPISAPPDPAGGAFSHSGTQNQEK